MKKSVKCIIIIKIKGNEEVLSNIINVGNFKAIKKAEKRMTTAVTKNRTEKGKHFEFRNTYYRHIV